MGRSLGFGEVCGGGGMDKTAEATVLLRFI